MVAAVGTSLAFVVFWSSTALNTWEHCVHVRLVGWPIRLAHLLGGCFPCVGGFQRVLKLNVWLLEEFLAKCSI